VPRPRQRHILHVDMDAFFVSVELRRRPDLVGQPVVVGGTGRRGVVAAASYEARRYGVHSAMPSAVARRRCAHAVFLPGDHALYSEVSSQVREIFDRYTPLVEPLSLDEAFLDVTGSIRLFGPAPQIACRHPSRHPRRARPDLLRRRRAQQVPRQAGLGRGQAGGVTVGCRPRSRRRRRRAGQEQEFLRPLPVERLWGVGPVTLDRLHRIGVRRVYDLVAVDPAVLASALGRAQAEHLLALALGVDDRAVEPEREAKSISHEETFEANVTEASELRTHLVRLADAVAARLRHAGVGARTLTAKVRFDDGFRTITRSTTCREPVDQAETIIALLQPILDGIDPSPGIRLLGVGGSNLAAVHHQLTLEDAADDHVEHGAREAALDQIRERFGVDAIGRASSIRAGKVRNVKRGEQQWGPQEH
jgi:DNA polymerase IV